MTSERFTEIKARLGLTTTGAVCTCNEYNCPCHFDLPEAMATIEQLMKMDRGRMGEAFSLLHEDASGWLAYAAAPRSSKWAATRATHLAEHPTCEACGTAKMCEVHHVLPFHTHPEMELDPGNLITLCESPSHNCHLIFGHLLNWASWNTSVREDAAAFRERVEKRPHEAK